ncbi:hypothetical protein [Clostridium senegalense]|uniref:hypothetical protein n=1 Tax=Clostridium senegalense TaxID=1465809 RepID=UPI001C0F8FED|nr:hypothetical protein [Clostridium senegalense]MBU5227914.1 hypothetical protein [Clostridium senegalense]
MSYDNTIIITGNKSKLKNFYNDFKKDGKFSLANIISEPFKKDIEDKKGIIVDKKFLNNRVLRLVYNKKQRDVYKKVRNDLVKKVCKNNGLVPKGIKKDNPINYYLYINNKTGNIEFDINAWRYIHWGNNVDEGKNIYYEDLKEDRILLKSTNNGMLPLEFILYCEKKYKGIKFRCFTDKDYGKPDIYEFIINKENRTTKILKYNKMDFMINIMEFDKMTAYRKLYDNLLEELLLRHKYNKEELVDCSIFKTALKAAYEYNIDLKGTCSEELIKINKI